MVQRQVEWKRKEKASGDSPRVNTGIESRINELKGSGQPLKESLRTYFEGRFGADFSRVRLHTNLQASETAKAINARAFTIGENIIFGMGQCSPETSGGKRLISHELTHVVQQTSGVTAEEVQRAIGDGHDLTNSLFKGDHVLEACYDNERFLFMGHRGSAVEKIQQALVELGFPLPVFGVDGIFGSETNAAVKKYQKSRGLLTDGVVGPSTMFSLDKEPQLVGPPQAQGVPPGVEIPPQLNVMPKAEMMRVMVDSNTASNDLVWDAVGKLNYMKNEVDKNKRYPTPSEPTWRAYEGVRKYLYGYKGFQKYTPGFPNDISAFIRDVDKAMMYMIRNATFPAVPVEDVVEPTIACIPEKDYARSYVNARGTYSADPSIYYCYLFFFKAGPQCRRSVTTHERFHLVGLKHGEEIPKNPGKAEFNTNNMNELVKFVMNKEASPCR